eukprot:CAMPEP_0179236838 /NCGR_PEP_ID=MMETSP0797-20121207/14135_1 /TAXON_ID=47934 /ORGANISM="Dinophysis acuminata, Strain DAEP01" /LENGTH=335 /DNA_ID=CAMNT_0020944109 /DNA_START=42 /DNA_END=1046 /DNA_ORIENTATION=-
MSQPTGADLCQAVLGDSLAELRRRVERDGPSDLQGYRGQIGQPVPPGHTLVFQAIQRTAEAAEVFNFLVDEIGLDPDLPGDGVRQTPLFYAAGKLGNPEAVARLLERRANVNFADKNKQTPLFYAARCGQVVCLKALLGGRAEVDVRDVNEQTPIFYASKHSQFSCAQALLEHESGNTAQVTDKWGRTALFDASDSEICLLLLKHQCNVNLVDANGQSALFFAASEGDDAKARVLLQHQAEVDLNDRYAQTALFWACENGRTSTCRLLIEEGRSNPHHLDKLGKSPVALARVPTAPPRPARPPELVAYFKSQEQQPAPGAEGGHRADSTPKRRGR